MKKISSLFLTLLLVATTIEIANSACVDCHLNCLPAGATRGNEAKMSANYIGGPQAKVTLYISNVSANPTQARNCVARYNNCVANQGCTGMPFAVIR